jgi:hypothetical protein
MPIVKANQSYEMKKEQVEEKTNPVSSEAEPPRLLPSHNEEQWPHLASGTIETHEAPLGENEDEKDTDSSDEWETLSPGKYENIESEGCKVASPVREEVQHVHTTKKLLLHRCSSTPEFSNLEDEDSYVLDCSTESVDDHSLPLVDDNLVMISHKVQPPMKKIPSFKDIIMLNAQGRHEEEQKKRNIVQEHQEKMRNLAIQRRKSNKPKLVVNSIKRCAKSTGDLRSLVIHENPEEDSFGGSRGGIVHDVIHENEILGETDAMEFYSRKSKGSLSRQNGAKIRPDEAKRREIIMFKKNAQKMAQQERSN